MKVQYEKVFEWCDKVIRFSFYALIYFLPISTALVESFASLALVVFFIKRGFLFFSSLKSNPAKHSSFGRKIKLFLRSYKPVTTVLSWPIGIFILVNFLSSLTSQYPPLSFSAFFFKVLQETFLYFTFIEAFKTKKQLIILIVIFFLSSLLTTINGMFQFINGIGFIRGNILNKPGRIRSCFRHANDFGSFLVLSIPLFLSIVLLWGPSAFNHTKKALSEKEKRDVILRKMMIILIVLVFIGMIISLGLTLSRGAWIGLTVALILLGLRDKKIFVFSAFILVVFFLVFDNQLSGTRNVDMFSDRVPQAISGVSEIQDKSGELQTQEGPAAGIPATSAMVQTKKDILPKRGVFDKVRQLIEKSGGQGRINYWKEALSIIKDYPFLGCGVNTYTKVAPNYRISWQGGIYPHNCYLQMTAEIGIVGLLSFIWIVFSMGVFSFNNLRHIKDPFLYAIIGGSLAGLFGFLTHAILDTPLYSVQLNSLMWIFIGLLISAQMMCPNVNLEGKVGSSAAYKIYDFLKKRSKQFKKTLEKHRWTRISQQILKNILFYILAFLLVIIVLFSIGEICFRIFRGPHNPLIKTTQKRAGFLFEPNTVDHNISSVPGEFDYTARINNFGYRGKDFQWMKIMNTARIFFVGDSFTFGVGAEDNETIPYLVGKKLRDQNIDVEVINAGVGHASPITHYVNLRDMHLRYEPDLVVLLFDLTDLWDDWHSERNAVLDKNGKILYFDPTYINGKRDWWVTCVYHSAFCKWINNKIVRTWKKMHLLGVRKYLNLALQGKRAKAAIIDSEKSRLEKFKIEYDGLLMLRGREKKELIDEHWPRTEKYLTKIKNLLDEHDIPLIIVMYPHGIYVGKDQWSKGRAPWGFEEGKLYTDYYGFELVEAYAKKHGIPFINTLDNFPKNTKTKYFFDYDGHMTPAGYATVADGIMKSRKFRSIINQIRLGVVRKYNKDHQSGASLLELDGFH